MNQAAQIDGELIAKAEAQRAQAIDALANPKRTVFSWQYLLLAVAGAAWGWFTAASSDNGHLIVAAAAGAGFFVAVAAYREAAIARRRIDALLALFKANGALSQETHSK